MENTQNTPEDLYIQKVRNIVSLASHGLFENIVYLYENKSSFDNNKEIDVLFDDYVKLLLYTEDSTDKKIDVFLNKCAKKRHLYKETAIKELYKSYNIDFVMDTNALIERASDLYDNENIESLSKDQEKDYLISLIDEELSDFDNYDKFTLSNMIALTSETDKNVFEKYVKNIISVLDEKLIQSFLDNILLKSNAIISSYKQKEFSLSPLTTFDIYSTLFTCQNQMIVILTFFDEIKTTFDENIMVKDNFFALKKTILDDDIFLLDKITDNNEVALDEFILENEQINDELALLNENNSNDTPPLHQYVDFLEEILFEDLHFFMQSTKNAQMGIKVADEVISTFNQISEFTHDVNLSFDMFFKNYYNLENKLSMPQKLIFNKSVVGLIMSQLIFLGYLKTEMIVSKDDIISALESSYKILTLEDIKVFTAYIVR